MAFLQVNNYLRSRAPMTKSVHRLHSHDHKVGRVCINTKTKGQEVLNTRHIPSCPAEEVSQTRSDLVRRTRPLVHIGMNFHQPYRSRSEGKGNYPLSF